MLAIKSKLLHVALVLLLAFIPVVLLINPTNLYILLGAVLFTTSVSVVHAYWPPLRLALDLSVEDLNMVDYLTMGIVLIFTFTSIREGYITYNQVFNPLPITRSADYFVPLAFARYGAIVAAYMALAARQFFLGPRFMHNVPGWPRAVISCVVGIVAGSVLIYLYPGIPTLP